MGKWILRKVNVIETKTKILQIQPYLTINIPSRGIPILALIGLLFIPTRTYCQIIFRKLPNIFGGNICTIKVDLCKTWSWHPFSRIRLKARPDLVDLFSPTTPEEILDAKPVATCWESFWGFRWRHQVLKSRFRVQSFGKAVWSERSRFLRDIPSSSSSSSLLPLRINLFTF